jgi:hypothetical protein
MFPLGIVAPVEIPDGRTDANGGFEPERAALRRTGWLSGGRITASRRRSCRRNVATVAGRDILPGRWSCARGKYRDSSAYLITVGLSFEAMGDVEEKHVGRIKIFSEKKASQLEPWGSLPRNY